MSDTVTRRRAIGTGTLFLGAGLLGAAAPVQAQPALPVTVAAVVNADDLAADCKRLIAEYEQARAAWLEANRALEETLTAEQRDLYLRVSDADTDRTCIYHEWSSAEVARHLPGLAPVIRMLWAHALGEHTNALSQCCTVDTGFEP